MYSASKKPVGNANPCTVDGWADTVLARLGDTVKAVPVEGVTAKEVMEQEKAWILQNGEWEADTLLMATMVGAETGAGALAIVAAGIARELMPRAAITYGVAVRQLEWKGLFPVRLEAWVSCGSEVALFRFANSDDAVAAPVTVMRGHLFHFWMEYRKFHNGKVVA